MSGRIPVLLLSHQLGIGGSERQIAVTASSLDPERFAPHVGCFHEGFRAGELRAAGIPVVRFPVTSFKNWSAVRGARLMGSYMRQHRIQLVHSFDAPLTVFGVPVARAYRAPAVLSSQRAHRGLAGDYRPLLRLTDRMVDRIVVNCNYVRDHLIQDDRVRPDLIRLCYNGVDTDAFHPRGRGSGSGRITIGVICALRPEKGLPTLLQAFSTVALKYPETRLLVVGSGPMLPELQGLVVDLGIAGRASFEPTTSAAPDRLREIDIFVLPSLSEAFSNSLLEAMACGCAAIASSAGGNPEIITAGETGLLFEPGNAADLANQLDRMLSDSDLRAGIANRGCAYVTSSFPVAACASQMAGIYEEVLASRRR